MANLISSGALTTTGGAAGPSATGFNITCRFKGACLQHTAAATLKVYAGADASGTMVMFIGVVANDGKLALLSTDDVVLCNNGVFYDLSAGTCILYKE